MASKSMHHLPFLLFFLSLLSFTTSALTHHHAHHSVQESDNPYFLDEHSFEPLFKTPHGSGYLSRRFSQISDLLVGIKDYRIGQLQFNPSTFMFPHHLDADAVHYIVRGRGTINLLHQQNSMSYNLEQGDVLRVPAGTIYYMINRENNDKFQIASLFRPVSTQKDTFTDFFEAGESFINTFSDEIVEAAYNTDKQRLDKLFGQQNKGVIVEASKEQISALTRRASPSQKGNPRTQGPVNLLSQMPEYSNDHGQLYKIDAKKYIQLEDFDLEVAFYRIKAGSMVAPFYNSGATTLVVVTYGSGTFEMACPPLASGQSLQEGRGERQEENGGKRYQKVSAQLSPSTVFIIPAGHPVSMVASDNQNFEFVAFKLNAKNNEENYAAGQNNLLNKLQVEAKELFFNTPPKEVDDILKNQKQSVFLPGPNQRQQREEGHGRHGDSLIETAAESVAF